MFAFCVVFLLCLSLTDAFISRTNLDSSRRLRLRGQVSHLGSLPVPAPSVADKDGWQLSLASPCKINLFLRILGRRTTGFHDLASLFQAISLSDYMHFTLLPPGSTEDRLICSDSSLSVDGSNLVIKALSLMRTKTGLNNYFRVLLDKNVPMQAGLGGGSGNAATAMFAFNKLSGMPASLSELKEWSGDIGSDITFFFSTGTAYCTGRGEIVTPLEPLPDLQDVVVHVFKPSEGLSTALVFKTLDLSNLNPSDPAVLLEMFTTEGAVKAAGKGLLVNDLEPPAFQCAPVLKEIKDKLVASVGQGGVMMSGSGTSIYALVDAKAATEKHSEFEAKINQVLKEHPSIKYFRCSFVNKEPAVDAWY